MKILGLNPPSRYSKNVARDLLWGCWCKGKRIAGVQFPPLPLMYVATVLKNDGHAVDVLDAQAEQKSLQDVENIVGQYDVVFLISATMSFAEDCEVLSLLKRRNPKLLAIVFGAHATFLPHQALKNKAADLVVMKESEFVIRDVIRALSAGGESWKSVKGIGYREGDTPVVNPDYDYIEDLDELPIPDRSFLPRNVEYFNPIVRNNAWTTALSSRGCPSRCTFCTAPSYYGPRYRTRSAANVVEELLYLKDLGFKEIFYRDELFTVDRKRVFEICRLIGEHRLNLQWICSVKASTATFEMLGAMKEAGCHVIRVGVETGVQQILNNIKKDVRIEQVENVFEWARKLGVDTHAHMMLGMPGETEETVSTTFKFIRKIKPSTVTYGIMTPYPGTEIYRQVLERNPSFGDGTSVDARNIHTSGFFSKVFTDIPPERLSELVRMGYRDFYLRPSYLLRRLSGVRNLSDLQRLVVAGLQVGSFFHQRRRIVCAESSAQ